MSGENFDMPKELRYAMIDADLLHRDDCSDEENESYLEMLQNGQPLPDGIYRYESPDGDELDEFYRLQGPVLTQEELGAYLALKQYQEIRTIRKCMVLLSVLAVIASVIGLWILYCVG